MGGGIREVSSMVSDGSPDVTDGSAEPVAAGAPDGDLGGGVALDVGGERRSIRPDRRFLVLLGLIVVVALGVRLEGLRATATPIPPAPRVSDAAAYRLLAANLADGRGYVRPYDLAFDDRVVPTAEYPPGLPVLLVAADLVGLSTETEQRSLLALVGAGTVGVVGLVARRLGGGPAGLLAAGLAAVHPSMVNTDTSPLAEPLAAFLGAAVVLAALAVHDRPDRWRWVVLGVLAGLGGLVRSEVLLVGLLVVVPLAWRAPGRRAALTSMALGVGGTAVVLVPWTVRNWVAFDRVVPLSNNLGSVLRGANCDGAFRGPYRGLWVTNVGSDDADPDGRCFTGFDLADGRNEAEAAAVLRDEGLAYVRDHLDEVPGVVAVRLARTAGLHDLKAQANFGALEGRNARWDRQGTRTFQVLGLLAVAGLVAPWRRPGPRWVAAMPVVAVALTVAVTYGNLRFRAVADPMVVVLASLALADAVVALAARVADRGRGAAG